MVHGVPLPGVIRAGYLPYQMGEGPPDTLTKRALRVANNGSDGRPSAGVKRGLGG